MIRAVQLRKDYRMGDCVVHALDGVDLDIQAGEFVSIIGASGSGKSTLMHILGCLDRPTAGTLEFFGEQVSSLTEKRLAAIRSQHIGFVFQTFNLISRSSALENVTVPLIYSRSPFTAGVAKKALDRVGLSQRSKHTPSEMSGGECQRVAIARAIVNNPKLILADEPTGNLDTRTGEQIMGIFHELHQTGITIVLVTHEMGIALQSNRMIQMKDGLIVDDTGVDDLRRSEILERTQNAHQRLFREKATRLGAPASTRVSSDVPSAEGMS